MIQVEPSQESRRDQRQRYPHQVEVTQGLIGSPIMSKYSESSPEKQNSYYPPSTHYGQKRGGIPSGLPTSEPSMVNYRGKAQAAGSNGSYPPGYGVGNESVDQVLFRSDGFDQNTTAAQQTQQHSRFYNQTHQIISHSNKYSQQMHP